MIELFLIRHGQSVANTKMLICGQSDSPLTDLGREQGRKLRPYLSSRLATNAEIISSPLSRALETAALATGKTEIFIEPQITELNTGSYSHLTYDELYFKNNHYRFLSQNLDLSFPEGESIRELHDRIKNWMFPKLQSLQSPQLVIFSHAYALNCILHAITQEALEHYPKFILPNASATILRINNRNPQQTWQVSKQELFNPSEQNEHK